MADVSRREFLKKTAADAAVTGFLAAGVAELRANPLGLPIGSQTYPHRALIKEGNFAGLLKMLADIGVQEIELCSPLGYSDFASLADGKQVRKVIADHGLKCVSGHFNMRELREKQSQSIAWASPCGRRPGRTDFQIRTPHGLRQKDSNCGLISLRRFHRASRMRPIRAFCLMSYSAKLHPATRGKPSSWRRAGSRHSRCF